MNKNEQPGNAAASATKPRRPAAKTSIAAAIDQVRPIAMAAKPAMTERQAASANARAATQKSKSAAIAMPTASTATKATKAAKGAKVVKASSFAKMPAKASTKTSAKTPTKASTKIPANTSASAGMKSSKLVHDSFKIPEAEYLIFEQLKGTCQEAGFKIKKSEIVRIGIALAAQLDIARLREVLDGLPPVKAGRPKNHGA